MKNRILAGFILVFFVFGFSACGKESATKYCGTWKVNKAIVEGSTYSQKELKAMKEDDIAELTIVIKEGKAAFIKDATSDASLEWALSDKGIKIGEADCEIEGEFIVLDKDGNKIYLEKVSDSQDISEMLENDEKSDTEDDTDSPEVSEEQDEASSEEDAESDEEESDADEDDEGDYYTEASEDSDFTYEVTKADEIKITGYKGNAADVTIPSEIGDRDVTEIGDAVFEGKTSMKQIIIWADIEKIGKRAFKGCSGLKDITVPSDVTVIEDSVFEDCIKLKTVLLLGDISKFGKASFKNCKALRDITIPTDTKVIDTSAFENCIKLKSVLFLGGEEIGKSAFKNCTKIRSLSFPSETKIIKANAFEGCSSLKYVTAWNSHMKVDKTAFSNCKNLKKNPWK